ncbi:MAG: protoglobin domain-containing protein [Pseudomonadota bacterium]|nr:protoglobin domain-containing protein [Pseudomonadota bacterium]
MKSWVGFGPDDEDRLRALLPHAKGSLVGLADRFYERILAHPTAAAVLQGDAQVQRLKGTLARWAEELLTGPWDEAYYIRRERIGRVHVEVGLPSRYMFTAMNVYRQGLCDLALQHLPLDQFEPTCTSLVRITDMDLAIMTGTYVESREAMQITTLQDLIVSHMPVTVLLLDAQGHVTAATRPSSRLFGDVPVIGRTFEEALPPALAAAADLSTYMVRALATGREVTLPRVDVLLEGEDRNFRVSIVPLDHPHARVLLHVEELTEAIRTEGRLLRSESLAQLGALSAAVAHELRNPLAGISGAIQVIARSLPAEDRRKPIMDKVEQQVRRLDALVTDLLDFARPTTPRFTDVALKEVAKAVADLVTREHPGVAIRISGAADVRADTNLVHQILLNLLLNACQAMDGAGEIRITVAPGLVRVSDSGPGISAENAEKIFQPFYTTRTRGTGLGLAICRKAAAAMNGQLVLAPPVPGSGACFILSLPGPAPMPGSDA